MDLIPQDLESFPQVTMASATCELVQSNETSSHVTRIGFISVHSKTQSSCAEFDPLAQDFSNPDSQSLNESPLK